MARGNTSAYGLSGGGSRVDGSGEYGLTPLRANDLTKETYRFSNAKQFDHHPLIRVVLGFMAELGSSGFIFVTRVPR